MTGKEAQEILDKITKITGLLIDEYDRSAFFELGMLTNKLASIISIDKCSFNSTVSKEE